MATLPEGINCVLAAAVKSKDEYLTGSLDWRELFDVAKKHPGYYSYAIVNM